MPVKAQVVASRLQRVPYRAYLGPVLGVTHIDLGQSMTCQWGYMPSSSITIEASRLTEQRLQGASFSDGTPEAAIRGEEEVDDSTNVFKVNVSSVCMVQASTTGPRRQPREARREMPAPTVALRVKARRTAPRNSDRWCS